MGYPLEGLRASYFKRKKSSGSFEVEDLVDAGYSPEEIEAIRGADGTSSN